MIARDPRETWTYVLREDRGNPREKQTVFRFRHLSLIEEHALLDDIEYDLAGRPMRSDVGTRNLRTVRTALVGWDNMLDSAGNQVAFNSGKDLDACLYRMSLDQRRELAIAIENEIVIEPAEVGKSEPPSA